MRKSNGSSGWTIEFERAARQSLRKLEPSVRSRILDFIENRLLHLDHPRLVGEALQGALAGLWRYRVGDHRLICRIEDHHLVVVVVTIGHRREIYR